MNVKRSRSIVAKSDFINEMLMCGLLCKLKRKMLRNDEKTIFEQIDCNEISARTLQTIDCATPPMINYFVFSISRGDPAMHLRKAHRTHREQLASENVDQSNEAHFDRIGNLRNELS